MIGLLKLLSPSGWAIAALSIALALSVAAVKVQSARLDNCKTENATLRAQTELQNQRIEMFKAEAALMAESLKKNKAEAAKLREEAKKRRKEHEAAPIESTCPKALGAEVRRIK